jgi:hypothetical protein
MIGHCEACKNSGGPENACPGLDVAGELARLQQWKQSILSLVKTFPEFESGEWAGNKNGWGFVFELIKWVYNELARLRARVAELEEDDRQWEKHGLVEIVKERDRLRAKVEAAKEMADWMKENFGYTIRGIGDEVLRQAFITINHESAELVKRFEEAGK